LGFDGSNQLDSITSALKKLKSSLYRTGRFDYMKGMSDPVIPKRHAAGANPALRRRILDGAAAVFLDRGFDAAGVKDICRAADVSKSTLYVYFAHKEELFEALVEQKRDPQFDEVEAALRLPPDRALHQFLRHLVTVVCSPEVVRAQRTIIGIAERMPKFDARFYEGGAERAQKMLRAYLDARVAAGEFVIPDTHRASYQLIELSSAGLLRQCLYGLRTKAPSAPEVQSAVASALAMFYAAYRPVDRPA
jgi:TetR/AcrR family transcriptional regulator of autoinduction and epiphytic fitness